MTAVFFAMPGNEALAAALANGMAAEPGRLEYRKFPDRESYLRFHGDVSGSNAVLACSLHDPDSKALPLLLAAAALRDLGVKSVGLVAPYLAYMRQDRRFKDGEAVTSLAFARLLSGAFDWIATIDPHLHRYASMAEIYSVPVLVGHATPVLMDYLRKRHGTIFLVGPDEESEQWVSYVAKAAGAPYVTLRKTRRGDNDVSVSFPDITRFEGLAPVLIDDIISSGHTMQVAVAQLVALGFGQPVCLAAHGILAADAMERLKAAGAVIVTTNTIPGPTAVLDLNPLLVELIRPKLFGELKP
jgi:ribose-phosphate pyrophosphokinase